MAFSSSPSFVHVIVNVENPSTVKSVLICSTLSPSAVLDVLTATLPSVSSAKSATVFATVSPLSSEVIWFTSTVSGTIRVVSSVTSSITAFLTLKETLTG